MSKLPYEVGDWFAVPLENGGFGIGIVARSAPRGKILLGYFFGHQRQHPPSLGELSAIESRSAVLIAIFGDLGLCKATWPVLGHHRSWNREDWPMPSFARTDPISGAIQKVSYADDNPNQVINQVLCGKDEAERLPRDGVWGYRAIEVKLQKILSNEQMGR